MTDEEEQAEMQRLTAARRLLNGVNRNDRAAIQEADARQKRLDDELSYLGGDVSTREKLRQLLAPRGSLPNGEYALFMARNRELVLDTLEEALRDPSVVPSGVLHAAIRLRELASKPGLTVDVQQAWVAELIASLPQRTAQARIATLATILQNLPKDRAQASKILVGLRDALITEVANGYPLTMLVEYWDLFRDPRLVSGLEGMIRRYQQASGEFSGWLALQRLMELAPDRARPFVVAEVIRPQRSNDFERTLGILSGLKDTPLPEVNRPLLAAIREQAALERRTFQVLAQKGVLAARLATDAIYDPLLAIYRTESARWQPEERAAVLSYLARVHEPETMPVIERELGAFGFGPDQDYQAYMFLNSLTQGYYSATIRSLLAKRLESDDPHVAESAASMMGKRGGAEDRTLLEKRLRRWRDTWQGRESSASGNENRLESQLVSALTRATAWKLSSAELESLRQGCLTEMCRASIPKQ